jgi:hypothetical protein
MYRYLTDIVPWQIPLTLFRVHILSTSVLGPQAKATPSHKLSHKAYRLHNVFGIYFLHTELVPVSTRGRHGAWKNVSRYKYTKIE